MLANARDLAYHYQLWLYLAIATALLIWVRRVVTRKKFLPKPTTTRDITMTHEARRLHIRQVTFKYILDGILTAVLDGEITEQEANDIAGEIARRWHQEDMMPLVKIYKDKLTKAKLRNSKRRRDLHGPEAPLPLPDETEIKTETVQDTSVGAQLAAILNAA